MSIKRQQFEQIRTLLGCSNQYSGTMAIIGQVLRDGDATGEEIDELAEKFIDLVDEQMVLKAYTKIKNR